MNNGCHVDKLNVPFFFWDPQRQFILDGAYASREEGWHSKASRYGQVAGTMRERERERLEIIYGNLQI